MERKPDFDKKSIYYLIKNKHLNKLDNKIALQLNEDIQITSDIIKIKNKIDELVSKVTEDMEITQTIKDLEYFLPFGNNNKKLNNIFFNSKLFLSIIETLNFATNKTLPKLLHFVEKMLKGNKSIAGYLGNNKEFIRKILVFMKKDSLYEICIKISEEIFMDSNKLIGILPFYKEIEENYLLVESNNLNSFCRILAIMIFDHKKIEFKQIFKYKEHLKVRPSAKVTTENQSLCYHLPRFIHNLVVTMKNKFNQTMSTANQIPMIYNLLNNVNNLNTANEVNTDLEAELGILNEQGVPLDALTNTEEVTANQPNHPRNKALGIFNCLNAPLETYKMFQSLRKSEIMTIIQANIFSNFNPNWKVINKTENSESSYMHRDNVFNTYKKMSKIYKKVTNHCKVKDSTKNYLNVIKYTTCQIEMLFVLSTLVGCKRKRQIQDHLSNYDIVDILNNYLEYMEWGNIFEENSRPFFDVNEDNFQDDSAYHGRGCKCDSDTALKIQFLRFIYSYCCRDSSNVTNKFNLISISDLERSFSSTYMTLFYFYLFKYYSKYKDDESVKFNKTFHRLLTLVQNNFHKYFVLNSWKDVNEISQDPFKLFTEYNENIQNIILNQISLENLEKFVHYYNFNFDKVGLLTRLIVKYIQECQYSSSKFWLASCIEVMIRGNNTFYQFFITSNTGLMPCLLYDIIYSQNDQAQILQLSFDILGELIKFNRANLLLLNYYFIDNNEFTTFSRKIINPKSLIDSNVFLRSLIISTFIFDDEDAKMGLKKEENQFFSQNCKFCIFITKKLEEIFNSLISVVKPDDINQTNISCINSALLILILKYFKGEMGSFIQNIRQKFDESRKNIENFRNLITIWKEFYNYRPKDSSSLQHSTKINFNHWQVVTSILIDQDETNIESLYYKY